MHTANHRRHSIKCYLADNLCCLYGRVVFSCVCAVSAVALSTLGKVTCRTIHSNESSLGICTPDPYQTLLVYSWCYNLLTLYFAHVSSPIFFGVNRYGFGIMFCQLVVVEWNRSLTHTFNRNICFSLKRWRQLSQKTFKS